MFVTASTFAPRSLGEAHGGERVGGLARLGDADDEVARADDRVAVAVLGGDVHLDRDARPLLDRVAADQARRGSEVPQATIDDALARRAGTRRRSRRASPRSTPSRADRAVGDRLGHRVRLLVDLLEHERLVAALLGGLLAPSRPRRPRARCGSPAAVRNSTPSRRDDDDLVVLDQLHVARVARGRRGSRRRGTARPRRGRRPAGTPCARRPAARARRRTSRRTRSGRASSA